MHFRKKDVRAAQDLAACPALAKEWVDDLLLRVERL
jgi:hypothetical protein